MAFPAITLTFTCEPETQQRIETALLNSGVQFSKTQSETGEYRLFLPTPYWVLSVALHILQAYKEEIEGDIKLPDGRTFYINPKGIEELQQTLINSMSTRDEVIAPQFSRREPTFSERFIERYQDEVGEIVSSLPKWIENWTKAASRLKMTLVIMLIGLIGGTLVVVTWLTIINRISGEALIFLSGSIVGYIFAFLQKYLGLIQRS